MHICIFGQQTAKSSKRELFRHILISFYLQMQNNLQEKQIPM